MITNAKDRPLADNPGVLPDMSSTIMGWFQDLTFTKLTKQTVDYKVIETETEYTIKGVKMPMSAKQLSIKPEGQRDWDWQTVYALPGFVLNTGEIIKIAGVKYRVMGRWDWRQYGYVEYHLVNDYA